MGRRAWSELKVKNKTATHREHGWADFVFASSNTSNTVDLGPATSFALRCPVSENTKTCTVQTSFDNGATWVDVASITLATGMNYFLGDNASRILHCQDTRLVLSAPTTGNVTLSASVIG